MEQLMHRTLGEKSPETPRVRTRYKQRTPRVHNGTGVRTFLLQQYEQRTPETLEVQNIVLCTPDSANAVLSTYFRSMEFLWN